MTAKRQDHESQMTLVERLRAIIKQYEICDQLLKPLHADNSISWQEHAEESAERLATFNEAIALIEAQQAELASLRGMVPVEALRIAIICLKHNAEIATSLAINSLCDDEVVVKNRYAKRQILTAQAIEQFLAAIPHPPASEGEK